MHWTALMAYRRVPENACLADDLPCVGCGYNLRGARIRGQCPECGRAVGDSLQMLARPDRVAASLRTIARSYLASVVMFITCLTPFAWLNYFTLLIMALAAVWRAIAAGELRYRSELDKMPVVARRLNILFIAMVLDATFAIMLVAVLWSQSAAATLPFGVNAAIRSFVGYGSPVAYAAGMLAAGWFASGLATMLECPVVTWEFRIQRIALAVLVPAMLLFMIYQPQLASVRWATLLIWLPLVILWAIPIICTYLGLMHMANYADSARDTWDFVPEGEELM